MSVATENPPITVERASRSSGSFRFQQRYAPYLFVSPFVLIFLAFGLYPIVKSIILSLYITNGPKDQVYAGLSNYRFLLRDNDFRVAVLNTATFAFWSVFLQLPLSLGLALLLSARWVKGREWLRLIFFSPHLVGSVFVAVTKTVRKRCICFL